MKKPVLILFLLFGSVVSRGLFAQMDAQVSYVTVKNLKITISADSKSVQLNWDPPPKSGFVIVARSNHIIDTPEKLYVADSLGKYPSGTENGINSFTDQNLAEGTYYYAVVLTTEVKKRKVVMVPGQNFNVEPVVLVRPKPVPEKTESPDLKKAESKKEEEQKKEEAKTEENEKQKKIYVTGLTLEKERNRVRIYWNAPVEAEEGKTVYTVYKSNSPLSSIPLMHRAVKLAELDHPVLTFTDEDLNKSQTVYYGVSVRHNNFESTPLIQNSSFKRHFYVHNQEHKNWDALDKEEEKTEAHKEPEAKEEKLSVTNIHYNQKGNGVLLKWDAPSGIRGKVIYSIYESASAFDHGQSSFASKTAKMLGKVYHPQNYFMLKQIDRDFEKFYAVTVKTSSSGENFDVVENEAFIRLLPSMLEFPEEVTEEKTEKKENEQVSDAEAVRGKIDQVLANSYRKGNYTETIFRLQNILEQEKNITPELKGKIYFYKGISYFNKGNYQASLKYMIKPESSVFDRERADFWTKRCLSKISRGRE